MKKAILIILLLTAATLLLAGCTGPSALTGPSTTIKTVPTTSPVTPPVSTVVSDYRTEPLPQDKMVAVSVDRNTVNPNITIVYRGGPGINFVEKMDILLTRTDGVVARDSIRKPQVNDQITVLGTMEVSESKADRIQVFITLVTGDKYLIYNETLPFKSHG
jgi:ABC-type glycerol-3-phosphate transport system substrate-binding protein